MAEEFQESDVIFSDHHVQYTTTQIDDDGDNDNFYSSKHHHHHHVTRVVSRVSCQKGKNKKKMIKKLSSSVPVNIPDNMFQCKDRDVLEEEECDEGEVIPPHLIIGRRITGQMAFSVQTGNGRTLKGRDLSQVRNSVLRMTGFLET